MPRPSSCLLALLPLLLAGCQVKREEGNGANQANAADAAPGNATNAQGETAMVAPDYAGTLVPPAPGEPGGLPDDREPLNESYARVPTRAEASGATIEQWGIALGEGRYGDAYRMWADGGKQSGMSEAQFADAWRKYGEIHVMAGRPGQGGTQTVPVPVQIYGRMRAGGKPFNLIGQMIMTRNPKGQQGEPGQLAWLIGSADFKPLGEVKLVPADVEAAAPGAVPVAFRGNWSRTAASCGKPGDDMRLAVAADSLTFYESVGKVTAVRAVSPTRISVAADYNGEGDKWSETSALALSDDGDALTIGGVKRVRCAA